MFNIRLKNEALELHKSTHERYIASYEEMGKACENLYSIRTDAVEIIKEAERVINSIANTPKEFGTQFGKIEAELTKFKKTEEYAKTAYDESIKAGMNIFGGAAMGVGVVSMAPTAMMSIATTFGTASTGTAISALSGAAAQKAAVAWIGRTFAGFAVKQGAGMAVGQAFLALAGPIGWGISAAATGGSLLSLSKKNKRIADEAIKETKEMSKAGEALDEATVRTKAIKRKTDGLLSDMKKQRDRMISFMNADYLSLTQDNKMFLGTLVNNTLSLSELLNKTIE